MNQARLLAAAAAASWAVTSGIAGTVPATALMRHYRMNYKAVCDAPKPTDTAICFALIRTDVRSAAVRAAASAPSGYGPAQLQAAYVLPSSTSGSGQTVALVEVGDYPTAAADLETYRTQYGLSACSSSNGCFRKVGQSGNSSLPAENASWAEETALDQDMVSAICPNCHILIVEANSATTSDLEAAENTAATLGATEISNSYGGSEYAASDSAYSHAGIVITASAGDNGFSEGSMQPCSFASVVCAGGTSLQPASGSRGYTEVVWNDLASQGGASGSGCSSEVVKPSWQNDGGCKMRSQSDASFDADPEYGVAVYDSTAYEGYSGWLEFGGTSVASPAISAVYALAGNAGSLGPSAASRIWTNKGAGLYNITSGNNLAPGGSCNASYPYICTAGTNDDGVYSGPGGWGTPDGVSDF
jgi:subtilase family serine protease